MDLRFPFSLWRVGDLLHKRVGEVSHGMVVPQGATRVKELVALVADPATLVPEAAYSASFRVCPRAAGS